MMTSVKALGAGAALGLAAGVVATRLRPRAGVDSLEDLTKDELYERAKKADIPGRSDMNKDELVRALRAAA
jgi:hypothetical protein